MSWLKKLLPKIIGGDLERKKGVPEGIWSKCEACDAMLYVAELKRNLQVCPKCQHHHRLSARQRLLNFLDEGTDLELAGHILPVDYLRFKDLKKYKDRLALAQKETEENEALVVCQGKCEGISLVAAAFEFRFMGGSMGSVVGERFVQGVEASLAARLPFLCFSGSGGARMQEGLFSLMQMAKTSAVLAKMKQLNLPFISILTDPTMGGVSASLAMLGDLIITEPRALIGFAGPRVIEQTVRQTLPEGFQRSEFLLEHGAIDMIIDRRDLRKRISGLLAKLTHVSQ